SNGRLTSPHQTSPSIDGSLTMNLSLGERPVCGRVSATRGPSAASTASPRATAISTSRAGGRFQYAVPTSARPSLSNPERLTAGPLFPMLHLVSVGGEVIGEKPRHRPD